MSGLDIWSEAKIKQLQKQKRRVKRARLEEKQAIDFSEVLKKREIEREKVLRQKKITDLLQTVKALELIGCDSSIQRQQLRNLFSSKTQ